MKEKKPAQKKEKAAPKVRSDKEDAEKFRAIFENAPDAYYINDLMGRFIDGNRAAEKLTGFSKEELIGSDFLRCGLLPPDQIPRAVLLHAKNIKGSMTQQEPVVLRSKDGRLIPVEISTYPVKLAGKSVVLGIARDVSERHKAMELVREKEAKYKQLFENMSSAFAYHKIVLDENNQPVDYEFLEVNQAFELMTGLRSEDIIGKRVTQVLPDINEQNFNWIKYYGKVALTGEPAKFEAAYGTGRNKKWYMVSSYSPSKGYFVAVFEDITESKEMEDALFKALQHSQKREKEISEMLAGARHALSGADMKDTAMTLLQSTRHLTGATRGCLVLEKGNRVEVEASEGGDKEQCVLWHEVKARMNARSGIAEPLVIEGREKMTGLVIAAVMPQNMLCIPLVIAGEIKGAMMVSDKPGGFTDEDMVSASRMAEIASISVYNRDTEEKLKASYAKLQELDLLKSNFMNMVSHELRTPFTAIKGFLKLLKHGGAGPLNPKQEEYLDIVLNNSERLLTLINDLLDSSKVESGVFTIKKEREDLCALTDETFKSLASLVKDKGIYLEQKFELVPFEFVFDRYRISQVIVNLLNNAIKVSPKGSKISLTAGRAGFFKPPAYVETEKLAPGPHIMIKVKDQGIGISAEECPKIFDRFYQVLEKNRMGHKGTGLGLSIAKGIVEAHGGIIWAESEGLGKGATFAVILPEK